MAEVSRNLSSQWYQCAHQIQRREDALRSHFPEARSKRVRLCFHFMTNDRSDRHHVLAAAVSSGTRKLIATYNIKHFPRGAELWGTSVKRPLRHSPNASGADTELEVVARKLSEQAENVGISIENLLRKLQVNGSLRLPFQHLCVQLGIELFTGQPGLRDERWPAMLATRNKHHPRTHRTSCSQPSRQPQNHAKPRTSKRLPIACSTCVARISSLRPVEAVPVSTCRRAAGASCSASSRRIQRPAEPGIQHRAQHRDYSKLR